MMWRPLAAGIALLTVNVCVAHAQNQTVDDRRAVIVEPAAWDLGIVGANVQFVAPKLNYRLDILRQESASLTPVVTLPVVEALMGVGYGWFYFASHGNEQLLTVESYPRTPDGLVARNASLATYHAQGYGTFEVVESEDIDHYGISVRPSFCLANFSSAGTLADIRACVSASMSAGFGAARSFLGYPMICPNTTMISETNTLYNNMAGFNGVPLRAVAPAQAGATNVLYGATNVVLAPIVAAMTPPTGTSLVGVTTGRIDFDCNMNTAFPAKNIVEGEGGVLVTDAAWNGPRRIDYVVAPVAPGGGKVVVRSDTASVVFSARSAPGLVPLDGNTSGPEFGNPVNGHAPNGDDFEHILGALTGGDNPLAAIVGFASFRDSGFVRHRWWSLNESGTDSYVIQRAPSWDGPFVSVASTSAVGPSQYALTTPSHPDSVYRLLEVETDGDSLIQATEALQPAAPAPPPPMASPPQAWADSVLQALQAQYPPPGSPQNPTIWNYLIFAPSEWISEAQVLANYWSGRGVRTIAVNLPGTPQELKAQIMAWRPYLRYVLLFADANDDASVDGTPLWSDPAKWTNGFTRPSWPPQPELNVIPMQYELETAEWQHSLSRSTPWRGNDWWYVDHDDDGLPDISIGRAPVHSSAEAIAFVLKTLNAATISPAAPFMDHFGLWVFALDFLETPQGPRFSGRSVHDWAHALASTVPAQFTVDSLFDRPKAEKTPSQRAALARAALDEGRSLVITMGTTSNRYHWSGWFDLYQGFDLEALANNYDRLPFLLGASCGVAGVDQTEDPNIGRPLIERFLPAYTKGPWGAFGPTRGTWQLANSVIAEEFIKRAYVDGASSAGEAAMITVRNVIGKHPQFAEVAREYAFIGDPAVALPRMVVTLDVEEGQPPVLPSSEILVAPNPARTGFRVRFVLQAAGPTELALFDLQGRQVWKRRGWRPVGAHEVACDVQTGADLRPGVYFLRARLGGAAVNRRVVLMR